MSINYLLVLVIILIAAAGIVGYRLGTLKMVFVCIALALSIFMAGIIDSGIYKALGFVGFNKAVYSGIGNTDISNLEGDEPEYINTHVNAQAEYIEKLPVPYYMRLSIMENNNSKVYEYLNAGNFVEYTGKFNAYIILCAISFLVSLLISVLAVSLVFKKTGISEYVSKEKGSGKAGGTVTGILLGIVIIYVMFAVVAVFTDTNVGMYLYNQIKSSRILNYLYENNIIIRLFLLAKVPIWMAVK